MSATWSILLGAAFGALAGVVVYRRVLPVTDLVAPAHVLNLARAAGWRIDLGDPFDLRSSVPDDPTSRGPVAVSGTGPEDEHLIGWRDAAGHGFVSVWVDDADQDAEAVWLASLASTTVTADRHDSSVAHDVRTVRDEVPGVHAAWAVRNSFGLTLPADVLTDLSSWCRWLRTIRQLERGQPRPAPPSLLHDLGTGHDHPGPV